MKARSHTRNYTSLTDAIPEHAPDEAKLSTGEMPSPDFKRALDKGATRREAAEQSINQIMQILDGTPARKRAMRAVQKNVAAALAEQ